MTENSFEMTCSKVSIEAEVPLLLGVHYTTFLVLANPPLKEISLAWHGNHLHEIEWVLRKVNFGALQFWK